MNEQSSKKIMFNKSTLWSLRAELVRKQEEVHEKKQLPQHKLENFKRPPSKKISEDNVSKNERKKSFKDSLKTVDTEELAACRKAKVILEKKAELYDHLADGAGTSQLEGQFLVDFTTKKQQEVHNTPSSLHPVEVTSRSNDDDTEDSEWTEFTDCLGRTRKCHKSDLEVYQKRDEDLIKSMCKDKPSQSSAQAIDDPEKKETDKPVLVQKTNDYLQSLREKWEQKEAELLAKDKDVHYQDLLFDEARMHGVAYYSFSTDEAERRKQMEELIKRRQETLQAQQENEEMRKKHETLMAERIAAARARQRARAGLPPEEPSQEKEKDFTTYLLEFLTQQKDEADAKAKEKEKQIREEKERERQLLRETYVREWDVGKEGTDGKVVKFRQMSQEEYVEKERSKRIKEFAPPAAPSGRSAEGAFDNQGKRIDRSPEPAFKKTWAEVRPNVAVPEPPLIGDVFEQKGLYFTSKRPYDNKTKPDNAGSGVKHNSEPKSEQSTEVLEQRGYFNSLKSESIMQYKNFVRAQEPTPIVNELDEEEPIDERTLNTSAEIAPPPTYDYYGPVPKKLRTQKPYQSDIREAYAQGAKSLEPKASNRHISQQYDFTFD